MFWFAVFLFVVLVGVLIVYCLIRGVAAFALIAYFIFKPVFRLIGRQTGPAGMDIAGRLDERFFGISRELEIVSGPLPDDFKATKPKLARDIRHDGRRLYFEVGEKSYSVKMDLEGGGSGKTSYSQNRRKKRYPRQPVNFVGRQRAHFRDHRTITISLCAFLPWRWLIDVGWMLRRSGAAATITGVTW